MAQIKNVKYGIMSCSTDITLLRKMKVAQQNIYSLGQISMLNQYLCPGDTVHVVSICSIADGAFSLLKFVKWLTEKRVEFVSYHERYLCNTFARPYSASMINLLTNMAQRELACIHGIPVELRGEQREWFERMIRQANIQNLAEIFASDGVKKRGN